MAPSPGLGPHYGNPLPPPSPNLGPHYAPSPGYAPPTQYGSGGPPTHQPFHGHTSSLSIPGMAGLSLGGVSPALQPYQGTYQNISPLPSPSASPISYSPSSSSHDLGTQEFSLGAPLVTPLPIVKPTSKDDRDADYDPTPHAKELLACLNHNISRIEPGPIIKILPRLSPAQLVALRAEYKRLFHQVNIAKHIKMQCGTGAFGKIAWATALGPYESEGWFANSWYQKAISRNELLIEALVGKTVQEIRKIKKGFKDDKYGNSLERAVKNELAAHKFRGVILMTLDTESGIRDEEPEHQGYLGSVWGHAVPDPGSVKMDKVQEDVKTLYEVLDGRPGTGETVLMQIILCRSQVHLREVIRWYRQMHKKDLSRVVIKHSPNLVGESLTHLLSGIIDKPLRDAKLLEDAIISIAASENPKDDLFISRCVRVHWDREHIRRVKIAYARKYNRDLIDRIREVTREDKSFRDFLTRMLE
ncbi:Annexin [Terfezia boudieri ATCC MYA-4762]|uniref:Annexin n=1 Tax=Terfezia boudieri ATCC MYA-4762 TaxID=1051890 RepID=A0A3N4LUJ6_9PEZI|nr:Annexin [Terfezia boudieri ATCC MYA-4762]